MNTNIATYTREWPVFGYVAKNEPTISYAEIRHQRIAWSAYYIAEKRGFEPGHALEDWLEAEKYEAEIV